MKTLPIPPELKEWINAIVLALNQFGPQSEEALDLITLLGIRVKEVFPEVEGKRIKVCDNNSTLCVYDSKEEWVEAMAKSHIKEGGDLLVAVPENQSLTRFKPIIHARRLV